MALIDKEKTKRAVTYWSRHGDPLSTRFDKRNIEDVIDDQPIVEAVPMALCEQIQFERDIALSQLKQLNIGLGEKPYLKAISIEWMFNWRQKHNEQNDVGLSSFSQMLYDWRKENEAEQDRAVVQNTAR